MTRKMSMMERRTKMMDRKFFSTMESNNTFLNQCEEIRIKNSQKRNQYTPKEIQEIQARKRMWLKQQREQQKRQNPKVLDLLMKAGDDKREDGKARSKSSSNRSRRSSVSTNSYEKHRVQTITSRAQQAVKDMPKWATAEMRFQDVNRVHKDHKTTKDGQKMTARDLPSWMPTKQHKEGVVINNFEEEHRKAKDIEEQDKILKAMLKLEHEAQLEQIKRLPAIYKALVSAIPDKGKTGGDIYRRRKSSFDQQKLLKEMEENIGLGKTPKKQEVRRDSLRRHSSSYETYGMLRDWVKANLLTEMALYKDIKNVDKNSYTALSKCRYIRLPEKYRESNDISNVFADIQKNKKSTGPGLQRSSHTSRVSTSALRTKSRSRRKKDQSPTPSARSFVAGAKLKK